MFLTFLSFEIPPKAMAPSSSRQELLRAEKSREEAEKCSMERPSAGTLVLVLRISGDVLVMFGLFLRAFCGICCIFFW